MSDLHHEIELARLDMAGLETQNKARLHRIRTLQFERSNTPDDRPARLYIKGTAPADVETDGRRWHIKKIEKGEIKMVGGGEVVGKIPQGLPSFRLPTLTFDAVMQLLTAAFIVALVAFMESISMAKAMAAKTKQRIDPSQELIGQGIANIGRRLLSVLSGLRFVHRFGHQPAGGRQDRFRHACSTACSWLVTLLFLTPLSLRTCPRRCWR
ncbi:MAG: SulP family inorganic anion transporter [Chromatiales bacterium]|nr:SulP family inorganic anion transporter [Chromatiales bacterium]